LYPDREGVDKCYLLVEHVRLLAVYVETVASVSVSTQIRSYHAGNVEVPDFSYYR
jgi:hypothetical protein